VLEWSDYSDYSNLVDFNEAPALTAEKAPVRSFG
jgi:hypothetical protein